MQTIGGRKGVARFARNRVLSDAMGGVSSDTRLAGRNRSKRSSAQFPKEPSAATKLCHRGTRCGRQIGGTRCGRVLQQREHGHDGAWPSKLSCTATTERGPPNCPTRPRRSVALQIVLHGHDGAWPSKLSCTATTERGPPGFTPERMRARRALVLP